MQVAHLKKMMTDPSNIVRQDLMSMIVHCADVSGPGKPWDIHNQWTKDLLEEFFAQGDKEKELGLVVSPLCSRTLTNIPESQISFISYIVEPAFQAMADSMDAIIQEIKRQEYLKAKGAVVTITPGRRSSFFQQTRSSMKSDESGRRSTLKVESSDSSFVYQPIPRPWDDYFDSNLEKWKMKLESDEELHGNDSSILDRFNDPKSHHEVKKSCNTGEKPPTDPKTVAEKNVLAEISSVADTNSLPKISFRSGMSVIPENSYVPRDHSDVKKA